ncbi:hypothetical protein AGMMS49928_27560 [Spirochaetia bacterium]|nr:hypothetical protein AGMMS49928_27560 [Spirochaetia bacterium]
MAWGYKKAGVPTGNPAVFEKLNYQLIELILCYIRNYIGGGGGGGGKKKKKKGKKDFYFIFAPCFPFLSTNPYKAKKQLF